MLSKSERIRRILTKDIDLPAKDVADRLANYGVKGGLVHVVRSTMRQELKQAEVLKQAELQQVEAQKRAEAEQRRQEKEAKIKLQEMVARVQQSKILNPSPLRQHIIVALQRANSLTIPEITQECQKTYKFSNLEVFKQSVRKCLRLLVINGGSGVNQQGDKYTLYAKEETPVVQNGQNGRENGIASLVSKLKEIVTKIGKDEAKELVDVL